MNKNKLYVLVIVALFISNGMLVFFMTQKGHRGKPGHTPNEIIIDRLSFNNEQIKNYSELVFVHKKTTRDLMKSIRSQRSLLYNLLNTTGSTSKVDSTVTKIGILQEELERLNFNHFRDIQTLCNSQQLKDFKDLSKEFAKIFEGRKGKPNRGSKR
tara:strand:- start:23594 stop:24061 length:468 start_codon:yes stop_codon:yes gene_type:complete